MQQQNRSGILFSVHHATCVSYAVHTSSYASLSLPCLILLHTLMVQNAWVLYHPTSGCTYCADPHIVCQVHSTLCLWQLSSKRVCFYDVRFSWLWILRLCCFGMWECVSGWWRLVQQPVYQSVQHHIAGDQSLEGFVSLYLVIPTCWKVTSVTGKHMLAYHCVVIHRKHLG